MGSPDVRVRLSAEGTAEVVAALKKVQSEAVKASTSTGAAAAKGASGVGSLTSALGGLRGVLGAAGLVTSAVAVVSSIRSVGGQALQTADRLGDMAESVGTTPGKLSVLSNVAATSGLSIEQLGTVMSKTATLTTDFQNGSSAAAKTMRELGISLKDLKGKGSAEKLEVIANRFSKIKDSGEKAALAVNAFGEKLGAKAIPFLNEVGAKGIEGIRKELERLGIVLSDKVIANVKRLGDTSERSQSQVVALGAAFLSGASGPIVQGLEATQEALGTTKVFWEGLGQVIGIVTRSVILLAAALLPILNVFDVLGTLIGNATIQLDSFFRQADLRSRGRLEEAKAQAKLVEEVVKRNLDAAEKRAQERREDAVKALEGLVAGATGGPLTGAGGTNSVDSEEKVQQRRDLARKMLDLDKSISDSQLKLQENANRRAFESGLIDLEKYYAQRRDLVGKALEAELKYIESVRRSELGNAATTEQRAGINQGAQKSSDNRRDQATDQIAELGMQFKEDKLRLAGEVLELQRASLGLLGRESEIQAAMLDHEVARHRLKASQLGFEGAELDAETEQFARGLQLTADFNSKVQEANRALADFNRARTTVQRESLTARLSEVESAKRLVEFDAARVPALRAAADALTQIAQASGNQELTDRALGFSDSISQLESSLAAASVAASTFRADFESAFESGLSSFLADGINQVRTLEEAFHRLARSIIADIQRISAQKLSKSITDLFSSAFSGGLNSGQQTLLHAARLVGFADGGFVAGPGTGRSDSVPAMLSRGEFVVQSSVASQPGIAELLMNLNNGYDLRPPSFAPIVYDDGDFSGGGSSSVNGAITVSADEGSTITHLDTPAGQKVVLKHIANNRRAIGRLLGGKD